MTRVLALTALVVFAPLGAEAQPLKPSPQFQASMDLVAALRSGDVARAMTAFANNAVLLPPGRDLISGHKAIEDALKELVAKKVELALVSIGSMGNADLGFDVGLYEVTLKAPEGTATKSRGKYLAALNQDPEGHWRFTYLSWNSSEATPPSK